ncbi:hypothetical protein VCCP1040_0241, partial [Vibrio cholerae CP1040(13)]
MPAP